MCYTILSTSIDCLAVITISTLTSPLELTYANMSLIGLPNELKAEIASYLYTHDALSLSKTCTALHAVVIESVYRDIMLTDLSVSGHSWPALDSLLRAVLEVPRHGAAIRRLYLEVDDYNEHANSRAADSDVDEEGHASNPPADAEDLNNDWKLISSCVHELGLPYEDIWAEAIAKHHDACATMSLLLARCVNLQVIAADMSYFFSNRYFLAMFKHMILASKNLNRLARFDQVVEFSVVRYGRLTKPNMATYTLQLEQHLATLLNTGFLSKI
jgi:hypothetical protein